jgi:predicted metal-dependent peptidase
MKNDELTKAKAGLILEHPFFGALALKLNYVPRHDIDVMATDGVNLYFNPEQMNQMSDKHKKALLATNVMHCSLLHPHRIGNRERDKFNVAAEHAANLILDTCNGLELPPNALCDKQFCDKTAERIYTELPDNPTPPPPSGEEGDKPSTTTGVMPPPTNDNPRGKKEAESNGGKSSDMTNQELEDEWKIATQQAAKAAKMQGNLPGKLEEFLNNLLQPKLDWREHLRRFMTDYDNSDYTWSRANRRHIAQGLYLPTAWNEGLGEVVVAIDTSASLSQDELTQFQGELNGILEDCPPKKLHLIQCDTRVNKVDEYDKTDLPLMINVYGRGGTAFEPVFKEVEERGIQPECLVYLTDLYGDSDFDAPPYPTMWVTTEDGAPEPNFGEKLLLEVN